MKTKTPLLLYMTASGALLTAMMAPGQTIYDTTVTNDNPVSYWPMQETTGPTIYDVVGTNNGTMMASTDPITCANVSGNTDTCTNFVINNGSAFGMGAPGNFINWAPNDTCIYFTNFNHAEIRIPYASNLDVLTWSIEAWLQMPQNPIGGAYVCPYYFDTSSAVSDGVINFNWNSGSYLEGWDLYVANGLSGGHPGQMHYDIGPGFKANPKEIIGLNVNNGRPLYAAMTYDGNNFNAYENGALVGTISGLSYSNNAVLYASKGIAVSNLFLGIGASEAYSFGTAGNGVNPWQNHFFNGGISHMAFYNYALTAGQIASHAYVGSTGLPPSPVITNQPVGFTNYVGYSNTLTVVATGTALHYYWFKGANLVGSNSATLALNNLALTNADSYTVLVSNSLGTATSVVAVVGVLPLPTNAYQASIISAFPNAYYPMNETSGNVMNDLIQEGAPGQNNGAYYAFPYLGSIGASDILGTSVGLDGGSMGANITNQNAMNIVGASTMEVWVQIEATNAEQWMIAHGPYYNHDNPTESVNVMGITLTNNATNGNPNGNGYYFISRGTDAYNGSNYVISYTGAYYPIPTNDLPNGENGNSGSTPWVYLVGVSDGVAWNLYWDGVLVATTPDMVGAVAANGSWSIGAQNNDNGLSLQAPYFWGSIQDVAIYNYALSPATIQQHYQLGLTGAYTAPPAPTVTISQGPGNVTVNWTGGNLVTATNLSGPWTYLTNPDSSVVIPPYTVAETNAAQYFKASTGAP